MAHSKRLRVFAGPNGSGKSTLFDSLLAKSKEESNFKLGYFINSDKIQKELAEKGFINLKQFDLQLSQTDFDEYLKDKDTATLVEKASKEGRPISISVRENVVVDDSKNTHSYEASLINGFIRKHLIKKGISYSFETVMSHPSKLTEIQLAKEHEYKTYLYFVCLDSPHLNVSRVKNRVDKGGHDVREDKIISRYNRTLENLFKTITSVDRSYLFDNSGEKMLLIAETFVDKQSLDIQISLLVDPQQLPNWFIQHVINKV